MIDWLRREPVDLTIELRGRVVPIHVKRHATARRMILRLSDDGTSVQVTLPKHGRTADAIAFARSRRDWLEQRVGSVPQRIDIWQQGAIHFCGRPIVLDWQKGASQQALFDGETLAFGGPEEGAERRILAWLKKQALILMTEDLAHYCNAAGVQTPPLKLSQAKRRWGSCAGDRTVRINWRLVQAPCPVRRSVVAHEVAHLVHFDHSQAFHALLANIYEDDLAGANRWLKANGRTLYASFG